VLVEDLIRDGDITPPKAAVVGTGRSGTGYVAALLDLTTLGSIGHENWWTAGLGPWTDGLDVDVSWLALPDIESGAWSGPVVHVVRHPVACIKSLAELGLFGADAEPHPYRDFIREQLLMVDPDTIEHAAQWWLNWNTRCEIVADLTVRVEDLPGRLPELAGALGLVLLDEFEVDPDSIPTDLNHTPRGYDPGQRQSVSAAEVLGEIGRQDWGPEAAAHWGYDLGTVL
jgi:hypothetical protein